MLLRKKKEIKKVIIKLSALVKDAIKNLNESELKIVLVVKNTKLVGTIVDGDIRRGMLDGVNINDNIKDIVHKNPTVVTSNASKNRVSVFMKENKLQHIPIVNKLGQPIGLYILDEINDKTETAGNKSGHEDKSKVPPFKLPSEETVNDESSLFITEAPI